MAMETSSKLVLCKLLSSLSSLYEKLVCGICHDTPINAVRVVQCDHIFCSFCINKVFDVPNVSKCPMCNVSLNKRQVVADEESRRIIDALNNLRLALDSDTHFRLNLASGPPFRICFDEFKDDEDEDNEDDNVELTKPQAESKELSESKTDPIIQIESKSSNRPSSTSSRKGRKRRQESNGGPNKRRSKDDPTNISADHVGDASTAHNTPNVARLEPTVAQQSVETITESSNVLEDKENVVDDVSVHLTEARKKPNVDQLTVDPSCSSVSVHASPKKVMESAVGVYEGMTKSPGVQENTEEPSASPKLVIDSREEVGESVPRENGDPDESSKLRVKEYEEQEVKVVSEHEHPNNIKGSTQGNGMCNFVFEQKQREKQGEEKTPASKKRPRVPFSIKGTLLEAAQSPVAKSERRRLVIFRKMAPLRSLLHVRNMQSDEQPMASRNKENINIGASSPVKRSQIQSKKRVALSPIKNIQLHSKGSQRILNQTSSRDEINAEDIAALSKSSIAKQSSPLAEKQVPVSSSEVTNSLNLDSQFNLSTWVLDTSTTLDNEAKESPTLPEQQIHESCHENKTGNEVEGKRVEGSTQNSDVFEDGRDGDEKCDTFKDSIDGDKEGGEKEIHIGASCDNDEEDSYKTPPSSDVSDGDDDFLQCTPQAKSFSRLLDQSASKKLNQSISFMSTEETSSMRLYVSSDLNAEDMVSQFVSLAKCGLTKTASEATHFVVPVDSEHRLLHRSDALLLALAGGQCVIVSGDWLRKSLELHRIPQPLPNFEPLDVSGDPGPQRRREISTANLLSKFQVCLFGSFHSKAPSRALLDKVLKLCGARTVRGVSLMSTDPSLHLLMLVDPDNLVNSTEYLRSFHISDVAVVSYEWLLDSVCRQQVQPIEAFLMHEATVADLIRAGYKPPLIPAPNQSKD